VVPVPGTKQERWVTQNAGAVRLRLTERDLAEVRALPPAQGSWE
jgi:diketogulonate reductase-like aldo/keto reductase